MLDTPILNENRIEKMIKNVAIYLRKSRGDDEGVLLKHKEVLISLCKQYRWRFVEYAEIASGDSIALRPEMQKLLKDIEDQMYDAVLVHDWDRLGRGDLSDQDTIFKTFKNSQTYIITANPYKVYDLTNEHDEQFTDFQSFLARQEYKMIKKRLLQGKKIGARMGNWTNGTPPFPYKYDRDRKGLVVDEDKRPIYRFMVESYLDGMSLHSIAWELNKMGIKSPRGGVWRGSVIRRLLIDETHLGHIISNKTEGDYRKKPNSRPLRRKPKSEWVIIKNCHEPVKTEEEHEKILMILHSNRKIVRSRVDSHPLAGLIKCGLCGASMATIRKQNGAYLVKKCQHRYVKDGEFIQCENRGGSANFLLEEIYRQIIPYEKYIQELLDQHEDQDELKRISIAIENKENEIQQKEKALERIQEAYEAGVYTLEMFHERMQKVKREIDQLEQEIELLHKQFQNTQSITNEERLRIIEAFKRDVKDPSKSDADLNKIYKSVIDHIVWTRTSEETLEITINFM